MTEPVDFASIVELRQRLRGGEFDAAQLLEHYTARIARFGDVSKAFISLDLENAGARAQAIDARGDLPLAGIPYACKDMFDVAG